MVSIDDMNQVLDGKGAKYVVETMWMLMEAGLEEVQHSFKVAQTNVIREENSQGLVRKILGLPGL